MVRVPCAFPNFVLHEAQSVHQLHGPKTGKRKECTILSGAYPDVDWHEFFRNEDVSLSG